MKYLYKYPQAEYPYAWLVEENRRRGKSREGVRADRHGRLRRRPLLRRRGRVREGDARGHPGADHGRRIAVPIPRGCTCCRRSGSGTPGHGASTSAARCCAAPRATRPSSRSREPDYGARWLTCDGAPELLFTENETNTRRLFGYDDGSRYVKDGINDYVVHGARDAVNPEHSGTKVAAHYVARIAGSTGRPRLRLRLSDHAAACRRHRPRLRRGVRGAPARGRRVLRGSDSGRPLCRTHGWSCASRSPACCGRSSSITTWSRSGSRAIRDSRRRPASG